MMVSLYYVIQEMHSFSMRPAKYFYDKPLTKYLDSKTVLIYRPHPVLVQYSTVVHLFRVVFKIQIVSQKWFFSFDFYEFFCTFSVRTPLSFNSCLLLKHNNPELVQTTLFELFSFASFLCRVFFMWNKFFFPVEKYYVLLRPRLTLVCMGEYIF